VKDPNWEEIDSLRQQLYFCESERDTAISVRKEMAEAIVRLEKTKDHLLNLLRFSAKGLELLMTKNDLWGGDWERIYHEIRAALGENPVDKKEAT
jgi:hypothetical protein